MSPFAHGTTVAVFAARVVEFQPSEALERLVVRARLLHPYMRWSQARGLSEEDGCYWLPGLLAARFDRDKVVVWLPYFRWLDEAQFEDDHDPQCRTLLLDVLDALYRAFNAHDLHITYESRSHRLHPETSFLHAVSRRSDGLGLGHRLLVAPGLGATLEPWLDHDGILGDCRGHRLVTCSPQDQALHLWDLNRRCLLDIYRFQEEELAEWPARPRLLSDRFIGICSASLGFQLIAIEHNTLFLGERAELPQNNVRDILLSQDESTLLVGTHDGQLMVYTRNPLRYRYTVSVPGNPSVCALSLDGSTWVLGGGNSSQGRVTVLDLETGTTVLDQKPRHRTRLTHLAVSEDGGLVASWNGTDRIKIWESGSGRLHHNIPAPPSFTADVFLLQGDFFYAGAHLQPRVFDMRKERWLQGRARAEALDGVTLARHPEPRPTWKLIGSAGDWTLTRRARPTLHGALLPWNTERLRKAWVLFSDTGPVSASEDASLYAFWRDTRGPVPVQTVPERWRTFKSGLPSR